MKFEWADFNCFHLLNWKIKDYSLLHPFVYFPSLVGWFSHAQSSFVQLLDPFTNGFLRIGCLKEFAVAPCFFDLFLQLHLYLRLNKDARNKKKKNPPCLGAQTCGRAAYV